MKILYRLGLCLVFAVAPLASYADAKSDVAEYYESARSYYARKELPEAIISLKNALQIDPNHLPSRVLLGKAYVDSDQGAFAEKELLEAGKQGADANLIAIPLAKALNLQQKHEELINRFAGREYPGSLQIPMHYELAEAYLRMGNVEQGSRQIDAILKISPRHPLGLQGRALILFGEGNLEGARKLALDANKAASDKSQSAFILARIAVAQGERDLAIKYYDQVLQSNPEHYQARMDRAYAFVQGGDYAAAIQDLERIIDKEPQDARALFLLGVALQGDGKVELADTTFERAANAIAYYSNEIESRDGPTLLLAAAIALATGSPSTALIHYNSYLVSNANDINIQKTAARLNLQIGAPRKAMRMMLELDVEGLQDPEVYQILGEAYDAQQRHEDAAWAYQQALGINPELASVQARLGKSQVQLGNDNIGFKNLESAFGRQPGARKLGIYLAMEYFRNGNLAEAQRVTGKLLEQDPNNLSVLSLQASIFGSQGDMVQARKTFEKILAINPEYRTARLNLIKIDLREGRESEARAAMDSMLRDKPEDSVLLYEQVKLEQATGNIETAIRLLEKLRHKASQEVTINLHLIELYTSYGRAPEGVDLAQRLKSRQPDNINVLEALAKAQLVSGDVDAGRATLKNMSEQPGIDLRTQFRVALLQVRAQDLEAARWTLQKTIDTEPNFYTAIATLAELEIQTGNYARAAELIAQLKRLAADNPTAFVLEGNLASQRGERKAAVKAYAVAHKRMNSAESAVNLFKSLLRNNQPDRAIDVLAAWSKAHPQREDIKLMLADINYVAGDANEALRYYESLVKSGDASGAVYARLASSYASKNKSRALDYAEKGYALAPEDDDVLDTYGWILTQNGKASEGLPLLRQAVSRNSTSPQIYYHLAVTLEQLQEKNQAIEAYETALSFNSKFEGDDQARKNLKRLKN